MYGDDETEQCLPCHTSCLTCYSDNFNKCKSCNLKKAYYKDPDICITCPL